MRFFFFGLIALFVNLPALECDAQTSKLPPAMPERVEMRWAENGGMLDRSAFYGIVVRRETGATTTEARPAIGVERMC